MRRTRTRLIAGLLATVAVGAAVLGMLTWRQVFLGTLNRDLIAAVQANDARAVSDLLARGADANSHDDPQRKLSLGEVLLEALHRRTQVSTAPSALQLALDWRPDPAAKVKPTIEDTPLIRSLLRHGAHQGPREILARMGRNYAFCTSYEDTGTLDMTVQPDHLTFRTAFVRPSRLYFEYSRSPFDHMVIWENSSGTRLWWAMQGVKKMSMEMAIASATGVSLGSAARIPGTLIKDQMGGWGGMGDDYGDIKLAGIVNVDGVACYKLIPKETASTPVITTEIDIDSKTFLLRKIVESYGGSVGFNAESVTIYHPAVNPPIKESAFQFQPPR